MSAASIAAMAAILAEEELKRRDSYEYNDDVSLPDISPLVVIFGVLFGLFIGLMPLILSV